MPTSTASSGRRPFHGGTRPGRQSAIATAATNPISPNDNGGDDDDEANTNGNSIDNDNDATSSATSGHHRGIMDIDDEEVRRFAESGLAQLLAEESEPFERFDGSGASATGMQQHLEGDADAAPERRQMAELLTEFDPARPPPDGSSLEDVQVWLECESQHESVLKIEKIIEDARSRKDFGSLTAVQRQLLRWYQPLRNRIAAEQRDYLRGREQGTKQKHTGQNVYGPYLCSLQPEKLAVILAHEATILAVIRGGEAQDREDHRGCPLAEGLWIAHRRPAPAPAVVPAPPESDSRRAEGLPEGKGAGHQTEAHGAECVRALSVLVAAGEAGRHPGARGHHSGRHSGRRSQGHQHGI